jgi:hypothetical protein
MCAYERHGGACVSSRRVLVEIVGGPPYPTLPYLNARPWPQAFALTADGELLTLALAAKSFSGLPAPPAGENPKTLAPAVARRGRPPPCRVQHRRPLGAGAGPAALAPLRGYLLLSAAGAAAAFNASGAVQRSGPRDVAAARLADLAAELAGQVTPLFPVMTEHLITGLPSQLWRHAAGRLANRSGRPAD